MRDKSRYAAHGQSSQGAGAESHVVLQDIPAVLDEHRTAQLKEGALFGELAALGRVPRTASVFAESDAELLEIRGQGLREIRKYDDNFRKAIDQRYRENALDDALRESDLFRDFNESDLKRVSDTVLFETYGSFDWNISYKKLVSSGKAGAQHEPVIARQGDYPDGLLMIRAGFARVSVKLGTGVRTITYLGAGDHYGLSGLYRAWRDGETEPLAVSLTALGYVDAIRVPTHILETYLFPAIKTAPPMLADVAEGRLLSDDAAMEWAVAERFINGTKSMLIDLDRCVRCDDCVRACASTHGGSPRFARHGRPSITGWWRTPACIAPTRCA